MASDLSLGEFGALAEKIVLSGAIADCVWENAETLDVIRKHKLHRTGVELTADNKWMLKHKNVGTGGTWGGRGQVHELNPESIEDQAHLPVVELEETVAMYQKDLDDNETSTRNIANILVSRVESATTKISNNINSTFYNDGTNPLEPVGFKSSISSSGSYAGITRSTDTYWQSLVYSTGASTRTFENLSDITDKVNYIRNVFGVFKHAVQQRRGYGVVPNLKNYICLAPPGFLLAFQNAIDNYLTVNYPGQKEVDLATETVKFSGVPIYADPDNESDTYAYIYLLPADGKNFQVLFGKQRGFTMQKNGIVGWSGWSKLTPRQSAFGGMLRLRMCVVNKVPGICGVMYCEGSTVSTVSIA